MAQAVAVVIALPPSSPSCLLYNSLHNEILYVSFLTLVLILRIFHYPQTLQNSAHRYSVSVKFSATIFRTEVRIYTDFLCTQYER